MSGAITAVSAAGAAAAAAGAGEAGIAGAALAANAGAIGLIGTGISAFSAIEQGQAASKAASANAQIASNNAAVARQNASFASQEGNANAAAAQMKNRAAAGSLLANQGASGVDVNSGSSKDTRNSQDLLGNLDVATIRSNAARQAYGYQTQATSYGNEASVQNATAANAPIAADISAGGTLLSNAATGYNTGAWGKQVASGSLNPEDANPNGND